MELLAQPHGRGAGSGSSTFAFRYAWDQSVRQTDADRHQPRGGRIRSGSRPRVAAASAAHRCLLPAPEGQVATRGDRTATSPEQQQSGSCSIQRVDRCGGQSVHGDRFDTEHRGSSPSPEGNKRQSRPGGRHPRRCGFEEDRSEASQRLAAASPSEVTAIAFRAGHVPGPFEGEWLGHWLFRIADFYGMPLLSFLERIPGSSSPPPGICWWHRLEDMECEPQAVSDYVRQPIDTLLSMESPLSPCASTTLLNAATAPDACSTTASPAPCPTGEAAGSTSPTPGATAIRHRSRWPPSCPALSAGPMPRRSNASRTCPFARRLPTTPCRCRGVPCLLGKPSITPTRSADKIRPSA